MRHVRMLKKLVAPDDMSDKGYPRFHHSGDSLRKSLGESSDEYAVCHLAMGSDNAVCRVNTASDIPAAFRYAVTVYASK